MPWYMTYSAIYEDDVDAQDGLGYYYLSFVMDDRLILVKMNSKTGEVAYSYDYFISKAGEDWRNKKIPQTFLQDPTSSNRMFLFGQFEQRASIIKFVKSTAQLDWILQVKHYDSKLAAPESMMSEIYSYAQSKKDKQWLFVCGYRWTSPSQEQFRQAAIMKMSTDGQISFLDVFAQDKIDQRDTCRSVAYDNSNDQVVYLLEVTSSSLRPNYAAYSKYSASNIDMMIVRQNPDGAFIDATNINYEGASIDFYIGKDSLIINGGDYYFGSYSWGFHTNLQNKSYTATDAFYDAHLFKYNPSGDDTCFHKQSMSSTEIKAVTVRHDEADVSQKQNQPYLLNKVNNLFLAYQSQFSGHFKLHNSFRLPKMCMDVSMNLTDGVIYYRGQDTK
jgi:hypothetical protein